MDSHSKLSEAINAINSFVRSLLSPFRLRKTNRGGPINFLPNEMMQLILTKLELDGDVNKLIRLRLVSTRWRSLVVDYCTQKKSLIVQSRIPELYIDPFNPETLQASNFEKRFFGLANLKEFTCLFVSYEIPSECLQSLLNLFPNVVQLSIHCEDETQMPGFVAYANSLDSLKVLDLCWPFVAVLPSLSPTLAKLEHFSFGSLRELKEDDPLQLVSHLGPSCVRVSFEGYFVCDQLLQWHNINAPWLANLTHLQMNILNSDSDVCSKVVHYLSEHANSLKLLNLWVLVYPLKMTPAVIGDLGKLSHLVNLELWNITMDISVLDQAAAQHALSSLSSVLTCALDGFVGHITDDDQFIRVFSAIFPNLVDLHLDFGVRFSSPMFQANFERHLYRFPNLRKYKIE